MIPNTANVQQYAALLAAQAQMKAQASKQTSIDHLGSQPSEFMTQSSPQVWLVYSKWYMRFSLACAWVQSTPW